ncbi:hypothetical protein STSP2_01025 [Anaerohalosphaera lusitana]|uniref:Scramblase n=1 Tax=Anaerohalosphaera lusitana TaxID=1936003 RepID=A0A1U9NIW5_9BACT|nr:hypothetical protein [Anaerohalosphaera lusitana]AQT67873.1 hypothetical protein STSP2_01025 [Anaerohalosphaera lusitana]
MAGGNTLHASFGHDRYMFRRKVFKVFGGAFHVYDPAGGVAFYGEQKAFKLKEDLRVYADERLGEELLVIKTPQILDWGATYYVQDGATGVGVGALRRKGLKSMFKDEWVYMDAAGNEVGRLAESSLLGALLSRQTNLMPQTYRIALNDGREVARIKQHFNPFILKYTMDIVNGDGEIDRRLLMASGILLAAIEGRQES